MKYVLRSTKDYSIFTKHTFNRDVDKVKRLKLSMETHGFIPGCAVHCTIDKDGNIVVKDGHHRIAVASQLGLPVFYIISDDSATIAELATTTNQWSLQDYLSSYVRANLKDYASLKAYMSLSGLSVGVAAALLMGRTSAKLNAEDVAMFKNGQYVASKPSHAYNVLSIIRALNESGVAVGTNARFVQAISKALKVDGVNPVQLRKKLVKHKSIITAQANVASYLEMIESIYNRGTKEKFPIAFNAINKAA